MTVDEKKKITSGSLRFAVAATGRGFVVFVVFVWKVKVADP